MSEKILIFLICILCFFQTYAQANSVVLELSVTMPNVISGNVDNRIEAPQEPKDKIVTVETTQRNGESVTVKTIVAK